MKARSLPAIAAAACCLGLAPVAMALNDQDTVVTAVFSRVYNRYERPVRADGSPAPQTYVISKGGYVPGAGADPSIDDVKFSGIVRVLANHLAKQNYFPAKDGKKADLMLVVHWGKTRPFDDGSYRNSVNLSFDRIAGLQAGGSVLGSQGLLGRTGGLGSSEILGASPAVASASSDSAVQAATKAANEAGVASAAKSQFVQELFTLQVAEGARDDANRQTANLLGYTADLKRRNAPSIYAGAGTAYHDLVDEVEAERYYVSVAAYDFQAALRDHARKSLWTTRVSIAARGNRFDEKLLKMAADASRYFGRDSDHLVQTFERIPKVDYGELKVLGVVGEEKSAPAQH